jgi:hypothetical protein
VNILKYIKKVQKIKFLKKQSKIPQVVILRGTLLNCYLLGFFCNKLNINKLCFSPSFGGGWGEAEKSPQSSLQDDVVVLFLIFLAKHL